jgi:two-component system OmpR family sensor kinase
MNRSLRWRLQGWYAVVLLAVVGGFATLLYAQVRSARFQEIDATLTADALYLDTNLRRFPPHELDGGRPDGPPPDRRRMGFQPGADEDGFDGRPPPDGRGRGFPPGPPPDGSDSRPTPNRDRQRLDRPGPPPGGPGRPNRDQLLAELKLPNRPGGPAQEGTYFAIWRADGNLLKAADLPPDVAMPILQDGASPATVRLGWRDDFREATVLAPGNTRVLVGRSVAQERAEMTRFAWQLGAAGVAVLAVGLAGGWLASARILRPIAGISATAAAISATNLSERINPESVDRELEGLARVLNTTFDGLEAAFDRQARFTADASHELRTPLAVLRSQAQLALSRPRSPEEYRKSIEECLRAADRMTALVEGLLMLARADAGKLDLRHEAVDLKQVTADAVSQLRPLADGLGITVATKLVPAQVQGDAGRLGQVVSNLVANAIRYNRPGGQVRVRLEANDGDVVLKVEDTGYGIPDADQPHIFERFYRVSKDRSRLSGGSGLGLAISKSIVEAHGGAIAFTSAVDQGTTFDVRLRTAPDLG